MYTGRTSSSSGPLKYFPLDLLLVGVFPFPLLFLSLLINQLFALQGRAWIASFYGGVSIAIAGALILFYAKLPLLRQGILLSFGSQALPPSSRKLYRWAYALILTGCSAMILLIVISRH